MDENIPPVLADAEQKTQGNTPKRRLTFAGHIHSPLSMPKNLFESPHTAQASPQGCNNDSPSSNESPFIKRKCFKTDQSYCNFTRNGQSPCFVSSSNLVELYSISDSPKLLSENFKTLNLANKGGIMGRRASCQASFSKHKSAPLYSMNLNKQLMNESPVDGGKKPPQVPKSNIIVTLVDDQEKTENDDLENLFYGNVEETCVILENSDHQQLIKQSLEIDAACANLIGDRSKEHILPIIPSAKHQDLFCISPETLVEVLKGRFDTQIDEFIIIDSRYPYEYEGGHIHNALNIFTKDKLFEEMFIKRLHLIRNSCKQLSGSVSIDQLSNDASSSEALQELSADSLNDSYAAAQQRMARNQSFSSGYLSDIQKELSDLSSDKSDLYLLSKSLDTKATNLNEIVKNKKRVIVIFHCEFSSERGPSLLRFLRNQDRALNHEVYPYLHYPELYLLEGGYKSFYENFKNFCDPQTYKPMLHAEHLNDLKHFRAKAKSWEVSNNLHNLQKKRPSVVRFKSKQN